MAVTRIEEGGLGTDSFNLPVTLNGTDGSSSNAGDNIVLDASASGVDAGERLLYNGIPPDFANISNDTSVLSGVTLTIDSGATITNSGTASGFGVALANDANNSVVTGTGSGGLNGEANLTFDGNALVVKGTSPSITIGDAGAEDTKIVFDSNAQDYYMGLDDTDDDLKIGLGSTVGTTAHMVFDEAGAVTKPLQPCVLVNPSATQTNFAVNADVTIVWGSEIFDIGGDFTSNTFTAPVTGKYLVSYSVRLENLDTASAYYYIGLMASNRQYYPLLAPDQFAADVAYWTMAGSITIDMDTSDTFHMVIRQNNGTAQTDIAPNTSSYLSIILVA